jgi:hypothetical protein
MTDVAFYQGTRYGLLPYCCSNKEWTAKADQLLLLICSKERFEEQQIMSYSILGFYVPRV